MQVMCLQLVLLGLLLLATPTHHTQVTVSPVPCTEHERSPETLDYVLQNITSDTVVYLEPGEHCIMQFTSAMQGVSNISIVGQQGGVSIVCKDDVGLAFINVSNLYIDNLTIERCGLSGQNLNASVALVHEFVNTFFEVPLGTKVGVLLGHVENVVMEHVIVSDTTGIGLLGINVIGDSVFTDSKFARNIRPAERCTVDASLAVLSSEQFTGGGAFFLYQDYVPDQSPSESIPTATLSIDRSTFVNNSDCTFSVVTATSYMSSEILRDLAYRIGGGGGLSIVLAQFGYGVNVNISSSEFVDNTARYGGGAHVQVFTGVTDCRVAFQNTTFFSNGYVSEEVLSLPDAFFVEGGGAVGIFNDLIVPETHAADNSPYHNNTIEFLDTSFTANGAELGGAVFVQSLFTLSVAQSSDAAALKFICCTFTRNSALFGSAMWVYEAKTTAMDQIGLQIELQDLVATNNMAGALNAAISRRPQDNSAVFNIVSANVTFTGTRTTISNNEGTALQVSSSLVGILGSTLIMDNNVGVFGGALNIIQFSYLIVTSGSELLIRRNQARIQGGAIYTNLLGSSSIVFNDDCFLHFEYLNFVFCLNCSDLASLNVYIEIVQNTAPSASIVYGSSLGSCPWAGQLQITYPGESVLEILDNHFPNQFHFDPNPVGSQRVTTAPFAIQTTTPELQYSTVPGAVFNLSLIAMDGFSQNVSSVISSYIVQSTGTVQNGSNGTPSVRAIVGPEGFAIIGNESTLTPVMLESEEDQLVLVGLYTVESLGASQVLILVEVGSCPTGFIFQNDTQKCECNPLLLRRDITCDVSNQLLEVPDGFWFGPVDSDSELATHRCLEGYCEDGTAFINVRDEPVDFDSQCETHVNRGGLLCGRCQDGYSIVLGSLRCLKCNNSYTALFILFLALGVLLIIMISYFRITITGGYLNGILFYSNIVSIYGQLLVPQARYHGGLILVSFLTLNFGIETCLYDGMSSLEKVWWQLSFPLYLIFLMLAIRVLGRCFKWKRGAGFSLIQGIATLSVLCYVSVLQSCVELISAVDIETLSGRYFRRWVVDPTVTYFVGWHGFLGTSACILLVFYIIPLPLLLLFPSALYRARFLRKLKPFYDAFWDPFEPNFRFWLGLRLIFRWIPFTLFFIQPTLESLFGTAIILIVLQYFQLLLKPFKGFWRNVLDGYFLLNLVVLFLSSVFFRAIAESKSSDEADHDFTKASALSIALVALAYLGFAVIVIYHIIIRYPKLEEKMRELVKRRMTKEKPAKPQDRSVEVSTRTVGYTELREPLLDAGSLEVVTFTASRALTPESNHSPHQSQMSET